LQVKPETTNWPFPQTLQKAGKAPLTKRKFESLSFKLLLSVEVGIYGGLDSGDFRPLV
jgi:hypothetical protein